MAEDNYSRTEPASERRIAQARAEGHVPRSFALSSFMMVGALVAGLFLWGARLLDRWQAVLSEYFYGVAQASFDSGFTLLSSLLVEAVPFMAVLMLAAILAPILLSGWVFAPRAMQFQPARLNPLSRLLRLFTLDGMFGGFKALLVWLATAGALVWLFQAHLDDLSALVMQPLEAALPKAGNLLLKGMLVLLGIPALAALLDAPWQWWRYLKGLAMTRAEVLAEAREAEGDAAYRARVLARRRGIHEQGRKARAG